MAVEIRNLIHAMCECAGPIPDSLHVNGVAMQAYGVKKMVRVDVGSYYFVLDQPVQFDVIPNGPELDRPPFMGSFPLANNFLVGLDGAGRVLMQFIPSDIPLDPGDPTEILGAVAMQVFDSLGAPTDEFLINWLVLDYPRGQDRGEVNWPALEGQPGSFAP